MALPATFQVGARIGVVGTGGQLYVDGDRVVLSLGRLSKYVSDLTAVVHRQASVTVLDIPLLPPWMNTRIIVEDGDRTALATLPMWSRRRLRAALREAGFAIEERRSWSRAGADLLQS